MSGDNEDIFTGISFGKWNILYIAVVCLQQASSPAQYYSSVFVNMPIGFKCSDDALKLTNASYDGSCFETINHIEISEYNETVHKCTKYEFDTSQVSSTFTSEFQLVCENSLLSSMYDPIFPIGSIIGTLFTGASDKWGRVTVIQISSIIHAGGSLFIGLDSHGWLVVLGRFIVGFTYPILVGSAIPLSLETMSPKYRSTVGFLMFLPFNASVMILGILAYFIRGWRMLYLVASLPIYIIPVISLFLDKSPRWLIQQGRLDEAKIILQKAAKMNKGNVNFDSISIHKGAIADSNEYKLKSNFFFATLKSAKKIVLQFFGTAIMLKISLILPSIWFLSAFVYFGVPLNANGFTDNPFLYIIMIGIVECPAAFIGPYVIKRFGNIKIGVSLFLITGGCMLGTLLVTDSIWWMKWVFTMLSMTSIGAIITLCQILISELFPTVLRTTGHGLCSTAYYAGFFISSFINNTFSSKTWWAFNTMCGICSIIAAGLICLLPETQGQKLSETVDDVNDREKGTDVATILNPGEIMSYNN